MRLDRRQTKQSPHELRQARRRGRLQTVVGITRDFRIPEDGLPVLEIVDNHQRNVAAPGQRLSCRDPYRLIAHHQVEILALETECRTVLGADHALSLLPAPGTANPEHIVQLPARQISSVLVH